MLTLHTGRWVHEARNGKAREQVRGYDRVVSEAYSITCNANYKNSQQINGHRWQQICRRLERAEGRRYSLP